MRLLSVSLFLNAIFTCNSRFCSLNHPDIAHNYCLYEKLTYKNYPSETSPENLYIKFESWTKFLNEFLIKKLAIIRILYGRFELKKC